MQEEMDNLIKWGLLAAAGGVARFLAYSIDPKSPSISSRKFVSLLAANVFVSGFSGLMGAIMMSTVTPDTNWRFISAGVFGFMGAKGLEILSEKLSKKIQ